MTGVFLQKGVVYSFFRDGGGWAMPRIQDCLCRKGEYMLVDTLNQLVLVATVQISPSDAVEKYRVTYERAIQFLAIISQRP